MITALTGGTLYAAPDREPLADAVVVMQDGVIAAAGSRDTVAIPEAAEVLDCKGAAITAGFHNSHVHFFERKWADAGTIPADELAQQLRDTFARYGFTSVFDTGSMHANTRRLRERIESGEVPGPRIRTTGDALIAPGANPPEMVLRVMGGMVWPIDEVTDEARAEQLARKRLDDGADAVKVHLQRGRLPFAEEWIAAAVRVAHAAGKQVFVHANSAADVQASVRAGVDILAHTSPQAGPWDDALLRAMRERNIAVTPTLFLWKYFSRHDRASVQEQVVRTTVDQLRAWLSAGGEVLFGTDLGAVDPDPAEEYALLSEAGMRFAQILASLTTAPAARFGDRVGRIEPGWGADVVVLDGDPAKELRAWSSVRATFRAGRKIWEA